MSNNTFLEPNEVKNLKKAAEQFHINDKPYKKTSNIDYIFFVIALIIVLLAIRLFVFEPVKVSGNSMDPTLLDGEQMIVEKISYNFRSPERGEIIICFYPDYPASCVKRIIGLEGDTVEIKRGKVFVNDLLIDESEYWSSIIYSDMEKVTVPEGHVFVMGDNRNFSDDSRIKAIGPIPYERIVGRVIAIVLPFENSRSIETPSYEFKKEENIWSKPA